MLKLLSMPKTFKMLSVKKVHNKIVLFLVLGLLTSFFCLKSLNVFEQHYPSHEYSPQVECCEGSHSLNTVQKNTPDIKMFEELIPISLLPLLFIAVSFAAQFHRKSYSWIAPPPLRGFFKGIVQIE